MSADTHVLLSTVIRESIEQAQGQMSVRLPGVVVSQDPTTLRLEVRIAVNARQKDADTDDLSPFVFPTLKDVPVAYPRGGGVEITWPLPTGTHVDLVFYDRSVEEVRTGSAAPVTPASPRRFSLSDAVAIPVDVRDTAVPSTATAAAVVGGAFVLDHDDIRFGGPAAVAVALANLVVTELNSLKTAFDSHVHAAAGVATSLPIDALQLPSIVPAPAPPVGNVGATTTKAV